MSQILSFRCLRKLGLLGLVLLLPLLLIFGTVFLAIVPLGFVALLLPLLIIGGLAAKLVGC